ncbi:hypothetical protein CWI39_0062p0010 [Hamiltosporidium magnivora]|uniref:Uncharacterized protein n=1 Tax=Hamiltosporidium magnivora TaxID=148818 RepID=A0A4Q9LMG9_9MICR|nr:hypothetical protein CWI39_0062p0010 [Hamiltosporidium magnivora]
MEYNKTEKTLEFTEIYQSIDEFLQNTNEFNNNVHINMLEFLNDMKSDSDTYYRQTSICRYTEVTDGVMGEVFMSNQNRFKT